MCILDKSVQSVLFEESDEIPVDVMVEVTHPVHNDEVPAENMLDEQNTIIIHIEIQCVLGMCDECGEVVYSQTSFYRQKHGNCKDSSTGRGFHCLECGIALRKVDQYMKHMKELHDTALKDEVFTFPSKHGY